MICEKCGKEHNGSYGSGRFCSKECAHSRKLTQITKEKISISLYKFNKENHKYKEKKYMCGSLENNLKYKEISQHIVPKWFNKLIPFGFNINTLYTDKIINEYYKVKDLLYNEYVINKLAPIEIYNKYNCKDYINNYESLLHLFKSYNFPIRNCKKAVINAFNKGHIKLPENNYKSEWHNTWEGNEVYLRSSYESDYANELDKKKIKYEVESLRIKYFNSKLNEYHCAIPDFYLPETNTIVEIKSNWTLDIQEMKDKVKVYKDLGYNFKLILEHKEIDINNLNF